MSFTRYQALRDKLREYFEQAEGKGIRIEWLTTSLVLAGIKLPGDLKRHLKAIGAHSRKRPGKVSQWEWFIP
jgi:hypothetical protein